MQSSRSTELESLRRGDFAGARELRLPGLSEFPREVFGLADTLEILDLGGGSLTTLPNDMSRLNKLRILFCSHNRFVRLPSALGDCVSLSQISFRGTGLRDLPGEALPPSLRWLILTDNHIERLPSELGQRPRLQKLMLAGNRLRDLPETLSNATALELIRLSSNGFEVVPPWLAHLPSLAWISWAANPIERGLTSSNVPLVPWAHLDVSERLGEGASGRVHRAHWHAPGAGSPLPVALKIFKDAMTSDGRPATEMAACMAAGQHQHLPGALGRVLDHPDGSDALVMPLLPSHWRTLAGPPSFASCSRDIYDAELRLGPVSALRIAHGVAAAGAHLHTRGILHGDLYAHNIIWDGDAGEAVLSDFGAACLLPAGQEGEKWRRIEVRAWGLLLGELLDRCRSDPPYLAKLRELESACVQPSAAARPLMADVAAALALIIP
jgi:protein tyrosine kinase/Leucine Rich Repeat (LRR) protein